MEDSRKPKVVEVKRKPKSESEDKALDDLFDSLPDDAAKEMRKKQLEDITPSNPEEAIKKKKRFGLF